MNHRLHRWIDAHLSRPLERMYDRLEPGFDGSATVSKSAMDDRTLVFT